MFNQLFGILGCPMCSEAKKAILLANLNISIKEHIYQQDIHLGDTGIGVLDFRFPDGRISTPTIVIDIKVNEKGNLRDNRFLFISSSIKELDSQMFKEILM